MGRFQHSQFLLELGHQALELVGHFGEPLEAGVQQGRRFWHTAKSTACFLVC